jgi:cytochrome c oxidase subunit 2
MTGIYAGVFAFVGMALIAIIAVYIAIARQPLRPREEVVPIVYRARRWYFVAIVLVLLGALALTLPRVPYTTAATEPTPEIVVSATGEMWSWTLTPVDAESSVKPTVEDGNLIVPRDRLIEFRVTSIDVNHGFGLYDSKDQLVAQAQVMPGYINRLRYTFREAGTYHILCMEYCGIAHHFMMTDLIVR